MLFQQTKLKLHHPACYRIVVQGVLDDSWSEYFSGLTITCEGALLSEATALVSPYAVTTLAGQVIDQAMLLGVLNALYGLGLCLLDVECLGEVLTTTQSGIVNHSIRS